MFLVAAMHRALLARHPVEAAELRFQDGRPDLRTALLHRCCPALSAGL